MATINILKTDSELEKKVQQVEKLMGELGIMLHYGHNGLEIHERSGKVYPIVDLEHHDTVTGFPRMFESERLQVMP